MKKRKHINLFCYACGDPYDQPTGTACCHANHEKDWSSWQFAKRIKHLEAERAELIAALRNIEQAYSMTQITAPAAGVVQNRMAEARALLTKMGAE